MFNTRFEELPDRPGVEATTLNDAPDWEILSEIPKLSHAERREIMRLIVEMEQDTERLAKCDRLALERFQMLDAMEAQPILQNPVR